MKRSRRKNKAETSDSPTLRAPAEVGLPLPAERQRANFPIVAIGASAGGLPLFQQFFDRMPANSGLAFVLIQHLDPSHETLMPELLSKHTSMPVELVAEPMPFQPNRIYVGSTNSILSAQNAVLQVSRPGIAAIDRLPIDHFFRSLAEDQGENVIAIILSGNGVDGTVGLRAVKEQGGLTLAQSVETAKYESMPRHAISTGLVDHVLPVEKMPAQILDYVTHLRALQARKNAVGLHQQVADGLSKIFPMLRRKTGHDFSRYKQTTLVRRVQRRMQVRYFDSVQNYLEELGRNPKELDDLFKDLLIGVTQFFRDPEAFDVLAKQVIPDLFRDKPADGQVRAWIPGCATGEEAYSIAILLAEHAAQLETPPSVQIFGTDLDDVALEVARKGVYSEQIAEHVSPERLKQFFRWRGADYEVVSEIREMCVFSPHNLIKDPPFSRQDLISCRNLLIYLEADLQRKLLPVFHYALNPSGYLFLGPAENVASRSELFRTVDKRHRLFQRKPSMLRQELKIPMMEPGRVTRLQPLPTPPPLSSTTREQNVIRTIERVILEEYAPASVIINEQGEVVYFSGHTGKFLEPAVGAPSNKIINLARRSLRLELRTALHRAVTTREEVIRPNIVVKTSGRAETINLIVRPLIELGRDAGLYVVIFQELVSAGKKAPKKNEQEVESPLLRQLENELRTTKEDLQTTIEELETSNEELKSANEELLSMNEELQSTNEELQTSKEELQSLNDELQRKIEELDTAHTDLANLFQSTQLATLFLDPQLRIKRFTPAINQVIRLTDRDVGRHVLDAAPDLDQPEIASDIENVVRTLTPRERQIPLAGGQFWYMARIMPYRALDQTVQGAVITFTEVTDLKRAHIYRAQLAAIVDGSQDGIIGKSLDGTITSWNNAAEQMYGYTAAEAIGQPIALIVPPENQDQLLGFFEKLKRGERIEALETTRIAKDGRRLTISLSLSPIHDARGKVVGISGIDRDITARQAAEEALEQAQERVSRYAEELELEVAERTKILKETVQSLEGVCYTIAHDLRAPLRTLQGFTRILLEDYASAFDEEGRIYAERIVAAATRMDTLIRDLLDFAKLSHLELPLVPLDLGQQVQQVLGHMAGEIEAKGAEIIVQRLPRVIANATVLNQVLSNLIGNALKFVAENVRPKIEMWAEIVDGRARLFVKDNGIGIDAIHHERIFGLFQRLHKPEVYPGTGIGLAIVRKGMERMGGSVGLQSGFGQGSCFYIDLRLVSEQMDEADRPNGR